MFHCTFSKITPRNHSVTAGMIKLYCIHCNDRFDLHVLTLLTICFAVFCFNRSVKLTGPFVTMIYKMCKGDLLRFGMIYLIFLIGFTQGEFPVLNLYCTTLFIDHFVPWSFDMTAGIALYIECQTSSAKYVCVSPGFWGFQGWVFKLRLWGFQGWVFESRL